jgi:pyruvate dehydrogenase E1 component alpha subunit
MVKTTQDKKKLFTREKASWMYQKILEIRKFEDEVHEIFAKGVLPSFVHLLQVKKR